MVLFFRPLLKHQLRARMPVFAVSKANMTFSMEIENKKLKHSMAPLPSLFYWYINTSSRGWSVASCTNVLSFITQKRRSPQAWRSKTERHYPMWSCLPSLLSTYKTSFEKPFRLLHAPPNLRYSKTNTRIAYGDENPMYSGGMLRLRAFQFNSTIKPQVQHYMSAFSSKSQSLLPKNSDQTSHGSLRTQKT